MGLSIFCLNGVLNVNIKLVCQLVCHHDFKIVHFESEISSFVPFYFHCVPFEVMQLLFCVPFFVVVDHLAVWFAILFPWCSDCGPFSFHVVSFWLNMPFHVWFVYWFNTLISQENKHIWSTFNCVQLYLTDVPFRRF